MADDPYTTLGVARDASEADIRKAYRKLAKQFHPDLNPGDAKAEARFKAVASANDILSDPDKRGRFDRGEIDADGQERPERQYYRSHADGRQGARYTSGGPFPGGNPFGDNMSQEDLGDILSGLFGQRGRQGGAGGPMRGADRQYNLTVSFLDAARGATQRLSLPGGDSLDVRIPPGIENGQVLRLRGKGGTGAGDAPAGDALIEIIVAPHPHFRRDGNDIRLELPVTVAEAVLGGRITVPTVDGSVTMSIPANADAGTQLRLRGKGIPAHGDRPAGDQYVTLSIRIGPRDAALEDFLRGWAPQHPFDPRADM